MIRRKTMEKDKRVGKRKKFFSGNSEKAGGTAAGSPLAFSMLFLSRFSGVFGGDKILVGNRFFQFTGIHQDFL